MKQTTIKVNGNILSLTTPQVMGIINVTPDSFYAGSRKEGEHALRNRIDEIIQQGGTFIDVGGCSTRPGTIIPSIEEEKKRLEPVLSILCKEYPSVPVSVDTFHSELAAWSVEVYGVGIINDISGGEDKAMFSTVARLGVPYVLMHLEGGINGMHQSVDYTPNVEVAVLDYFIRKIEQLRNLGVVDIIIDPGYGFSKNQEQNLRLLGRSGEAFRSLELPILTGLSRKRTIWKTLDITANEALNGTTVLNTVALLQDTADILRVHDVKEAVEAVKLITALRQALE